MIVLKNQLQYLMSRNNRLSIKSGMDMQEKVKLPKVAVLMSTYNGEKYIKEQLDSIFSQVDVLLDLYIRDDGSTDTTMDIIHSYIERGKTIINLTDGKRLGSGQSFMSLLYYVSKREYQYYAFADQDDIWLSEKLIKAISFIENDVSPVLYCSNQIIYENGVQKGLRFSDTPDLSFEGHITMNLLSGCTMVFNGALAKYLTSGQFPPKDIIEHRLHDSWVFIICMLQGRVVYDSNSYILYRIHEKNVVGLKKIGIPERVKRIFASVDGKSKIKNLRSRTCKYILNNYSNICLDKEIILQRIANYKESLQGKIELIKFKDICRATGENRLLFILKVLTNYV